MLIDALEQTSDAEKFCSRKGRESHGSKCGKCKHLIYFFHVTVTTCWADWDYILTPSTLVKLKYSAENNITSSL